MANTNSITVPLVGVGGTAPYIFQAPTSDPQTSLPSRTYSITGTNLDQLTVDATNLPPGLYTVHVLVTDSKLHTTDKVVSVRVVSPDIFTILNEDQDFEPSSFPANVVLPLTCSGQLGGSVTWGLINSVTTLPGLVLDSSGNLNFVLDSYGSWTVGVQAIDGFGNVVSKVLFFQVLSSAEYQLVDGQVELNVNVPVDSTGTNSFTLTVQDSKGVSAVKTFNYTALTPVSDIGIEEAYFDHSWGVGDTSTVTLPILGDLTGFTLGAATFNNLSDGLTATLDNVNAVVEITGPPTAFRNTELSVSIPILQSNSQIATITRQFTLLSHNGTTGLGQFTCYTRPYLVGDNVGLNPLKPYFNSPNVSRPTGTTVSVQMGSSLPEGLSLDANTGLIYGTLLDTFVGYSILEYRDPTETLQATVTINWDTQSSSLTLTDGLPDGQIQQTYSGSITAAGTSTTKLVAANMYRGRLPAGLSFEVGSSGTQINLTGTPEESGLFDLWIQVIDISGNTSYLYHRLVIDFIPPLVILTNSLDDITNGLFYQQFLQGFGGVQPYTWSLASGSTLPAGITLSPAGVLSGTTTSGTVYSSNVKINLTDSRTPTVTTTATLPLNINNALRITTNALPNITPGQEYTFALSAMGGTGNYTWSLPSGFIPPSGITFTSAGVFSGLFSGIPTPIYSQSVTVTVSDGSTVATKSFTLATGASALLIDTSGVGPIDRGNAYNGTLRAFNAVQTPVQWQLASGYSLPTGLQLQANSADSGITAIISGSTPVKADGTPGYPALSVKVTATDNVGNSAQAFLQLTTMSSLKISTNTLPIATVQGNYNNVTLAATGGVPPYTWDVDPNSVGTFNGTGLSLSSGGVISGSGTSVQTQNILFRVKDSLSPVDAVSKAILLSIVSSTLSIQTTSLPTATAGRSYLNADSSKVTLVASGGTGSYTWAYSGGLLPTGLNLDGDGSAGYGIGVIYGTTSAAGYSKTLTFTVSDGINTVSAPLTIAVNSGLGLVSGIDYTDGYNGVAATGSLGYIGVSGSVSLLATQPNNSFYVVATGVVATSASNIGVSVPTGYSFNVDNTKSNFTTGVVFIALSGPFNAGAIGTNSLSVTVTDNGGGGNVQATSTFTWVVYDNGSLSLSASSAFPQRVSN